MLHSYKTGLSSKRNPFYFNQNKFSEKDISNFREFYKKHKSLAKTYKHFNIPKGTMWSIVSGRHYKGLIYDTPAPKKK